MRNCKVCGKPLLKHQKSTCSWDHRRIYVNSLNRGRVSEFKGMTNRWTDDQRRQIGDAQRGVPESEVFKQKCRKRMTGVAFFKGHRHSDEWKNNARNRSPNDPCWKRDEVTSSRMLQLRKQRGICAICGVKLVGGNGMQAATADHDHSSGCHRGILCKRCNLLIGIAHDNTSILSKAIDYLDSWKT